MFVILDNLSANKTPAIHGWAERANVELCFTPASASWANPIEAQFGPLRNFGAPRGDTAPRGGQPTEAVAVRHSAIARIARSSYAGSRSSPNIGRHSSRR